MLTGVGFEMDVNDDFCRSIERAQKPFLSHGFIEAIEVMPLVKK